MATVPPGASPLQSALAKLGQLPAEDHATLTKSAFDSIARETRVPANVLIALDEASGGKGDATRARENALRLADLTKGGGRIEDVMATFAGDPARAQAIMSRSYDIADALYPAPSPKPKAGGGGALGGVADLGKAALGGAVSGIGSGIQALGVAGDEALKATIEAFGSREEGEAAGAPVEGETFARRAGRAVGDVVRGAGEGILGSASPDFQEAMQKSQPSGELLSPSTWSLGEDPSLMGMAGNVAQGLGSMAPVVAAGALTGGAGAAAMGAAMAGGEGADTGRQFVIDAATKIGEDGQPVIAAMPEYQHLRRDNGLTHEQATMALAREAENNAALRQSLVGALGGALTNKIMSPAAGFLGTGGRLAQAGKRGAAGFIEEGTQEALEGVAARSGIADATGADLNLGEDSFGNFLLGGLSGGAMGAAGGGLHGGRERPRDEMVDAEGQPNPEQLLLPPPSPEEIGMGSGAPLALPAPENGGTIIGGGRAGTPPGDFERNPNAGPRPRPEDYVQQPAELRPGQNAPADGSSGGAVVAPVGGTSLSAPTGAATPPASVPPAGPMQAIANTISLPAQMPDAPPARFPEYKPGSAIKLGDPETGQVFDAVFLGESPSGARIRMSGQELELTPEDLDLGRDAAVRIAAEAKAKVKPSKKADAPAGPSRALEAMGSAPGTSPLAQQATSQMRPMPEEPSAQIPETDEGMAARLRARLDFIQGQARSSGWDARLTGERDRLQKELTEVEARLAPAEKPVDGYKRVMAEHADAVSDASERTDELLRAQDTGAPVADAAQKLNEAQRRVEALKAEVDTRYADLSKAERKELAGPREPTLVDTIKLTPSQPKTSAPAAAPDQAPTAASTPTIEPIRAKAAVLRGVPEDQAPAVPGVSLKWDAKEKGFIFSRKHIDKVQAALGLGVDEPATPVKVQEAAAAPAPEQAKAQQGVRSFEDIVKTARRPSYVGHQDLNNRAGIQREVIEANPRSVEIHIPQGDEASTIGTNLGDDYVLDVYDPETSEFLKSVVFSGHRHMALSSSAMREQGYDRLAPNIVVNNVSGSNNLDLARWIYEGDSSKPYSPHLKPKRGNTAEAAAKAAAEADPNPTEGQKEAGNYRKGHLSWRGLDLTVENAKGSTRSGTDSKGNDWSVTMPAHYGYFRGTKGADGDHVDFYMGDVEASDYVLIVDQVHADTGAFDEHKVIVGTTARGAALGIYRDGFSDRRGDARIGGFTETTVEGLKAWLETGDLSKPSKALDYPFKRRAKKAEAQQDKALATETTKAALSIPPKPLTEESISPDHDAVRVGDGRIALLPDRYDYFLIEIVEALKFGVDNRIPAENEGRKWNMQGLTQGFQSRQARLSQAELEAAGFAKLKTALYPAMRVISREEVVPTAIKAFEKVFTKRDVEAPKAKAEEAGPAELADGPRLMTREEGRAAGEAWAKDGKDETPAQDPAMGNASADAKGGWTAGYRAAKAAASIPAKGLAASLSPEKQAKLAALQQQLAAKIRNQVSSGLDPEYITLGAQIVALYVEGGARKYGAMLRDFAAATGLSIKEAQPAMRAAYTHVRDEMELSGEDVSGFDDHATVMAETRAAMAEEQAAAKSGQGTAQEEAQATEPKAEVKDKPQDSAPTPTPAAPDAPAISSDALERARERVYPLADVKGGTVKGVVKFGDADRFMNAGGYVGHGKFFLRAGTVPEFDRAVMEKGPTLTSVVNGEMAAKIVNDASQGAESVIWHFAQKDGHGKPVAVSGRITPRTIKGREVSWADINPVAFDFLRRQGFTAAVSQDGATFVIRNGSGEAIGAIAAIISPDQKQQDEFAAAFDMLQSESNDGTLFAQPAVEPSNDNRNHASNDRPSPAESTGADAARIGQAGSLRQADRDAGGSGDRIAERAGERPSSRRDGAGSGDGTRARDGAGGRAGAANHVIEAGGLDLARGEKTRARESIAAIRTLRTLQAEGRPATAEERATLAKYGGAGTLGGTLPRSDGTIRYPDLAAEIESMTTPEERATLSRTSQYAFYTAEPALRSMWGLAEQLGFKGGRVYEPGMGVGGFAGTMPQTLNASYTGLELDHLTAQIAGALYPKHRIKNGDFIKEKLPQGYYDLVIGNPPFAGTKIQADADYPQGFMIHDYFFAKSLDAVRPGGLLMFITSAGTMNKMDSSARDYLADRADLVGAIRLPNTAFKENGTEVTTDIIVLRKRLDGEAEASPSWRTSEVIDLPREDGTTGQAAVNGYFVANPDMILGEQGLYDTLTAGERVGVRPLPDSDLRKDLQAILTKFPTNIMSEAPASVTLDALDADHAETKQGSFYIKDGDLYQFDGNTGRKVDARSRENTKGMPKASMEAIKALVPIKDALRNVYAADVDGKDAAIARKALNDAYDAYVKARGPIGLQNRRTQRPSVVEQESARQQAHNDARASGNEFDVGSFDAGPMIEAGASMGEIARARQAAREAGDYREGDFDPEAMDDKIIVTRPNIDPFMDDPESYRLLAIEKYDEKTDTAAKSRVFTENAVRMSSKPQINSPEDALLHLLAETGKVQPERIAEMAGSTAEKVIKELEGKVFQNPATREWETKTKYLSGNVIAKLEDAEREARVNPEFQPNVDALREVQPAPITSNEIAVPLGAHWFPNSIYSDFARSLGLEMTAEFKSRLGVWLVAGSTTGSSATSEWGTPDRPFAELMQLVMTNKPIEVRRSRKNSDGSIETWVDQEATQAATDKAKELQDRFKQWFWEDEARTGAMEALYNRTFNAEVAPKYDGSYLTTPGIHSDWSWRPHQTGVIARILQSGDTYMAHTVGAGKTSAMIGAGMEAKRLGMAQKPWYVVPNHMLIQFTTEFYQQYPLAKILVADDRRFHTSKRKQFVADAALGDYDAIIITHSAFHLIPPSEAAKKMAVEGMLQDVRDVLEGLEGGQFGEDAGMERSVLGALNSMAATLGVDVKGITEGKTKTRKKIEALLEAAEQRISRQTSDEGKDAVFNFDETGADMLFVDEAHLFRKLSFATSLGNIKGIDPNGSQASMDLFIKTRSLAQRNPGRSLVLASGTPITNTMAELYSISRYLQPQALEDRNISAFDSWAATFGQTESALEQDPAGGYKTVTRFSKFVNTPELSLMVRQVMDVVSSRDLEQYVTRPQLKDGKRNLVVVEASPDLKAYQQELAARMKQIEARKGPAKKGDDILLSVINDGRLAAIDMRLVDPSAGDTGSKLDQMVQAVYRRWKEGKEAPLFGVKKEGGYTDQPIEHGPTTQIVFSTLGVNPTRHNPSFSVHRYIKAQLVSMGVPADEIILSENLNSDARKQRAFMDMNEGKKRILIGSKTLFTGVNAQRRIAAIHNLDPLWFPADDEQRNGRGIRQGNMNREIEILDYSAKGTYDATMWQMMGRKAGFIEGFFRGDPSMRDMDDLGEASQYEQAKAMSTADPRVLQLTELRAERDKLARRAGAAIGQRKRMEATVRNLNRGIDAEREELAFWESQAGKVQDTQGDKFEARAGGKTYTERKEFGADLINAAEDALGGDGFKNGDRVATISGFNVNIGVWLSSRTVAYYIPLAGDREVNIGFSDDPVGMARKVEGALSTIKGATTRIEEEVRRKEAQLADTQQGLTKLKDFAEQDKLDALHEQVDALESELLADTDKPNAEAEGDQKHQRAPLAVSLKGDELGDWSDMLDLQRKAQGWYRDNLQGKTVINANTGWPIRFTRLGAGKMRGKPIDYLLRAVAGLEAIVENATFVRTEQDRRERENISAIHKFTARIAIDGRNETVQIAVREMADGRKFYDLNLGELVGARKGDPKDARLDRVEPDTKVSADNLNIQIARAEINGSAPAAIRKVAAAVAAELEAHGLGDVIKARTVRGLLSASGIPVQGTYRAGEISVEADVADPLHTARHEIVHALRDANLWGRDYGLFAQDEWRALVKAARADKAIRQAVEAAYPDLSANAQAEEMVAELYADWAARRGETPSGALGAALGRIQSLFRALASALRGGGFVDAARVMERMANGEIGGRGPDGGPPAGRNRNADNGGEKEQRDLSNLKASLSKSKGKALGMIGNLHWKTIPAMASSLLTDAMGKNDRMNALSLVPGRALFSELGKSLPAAQEYLGLKEKMDAGRNKWQARSATMVDKWTKTASRNPEGNQALMQIMHESTLAQLDPSKPDGWKRMEDDEADRVGPKSPKDRRDWAAKVKADRAQRQKDHAALVDSFEKLPKPMRELYSEVRDEYSAMADEMDLALVENIRTMSRIIVRKATREHKKELARIRDEGLTGEARAEALGKANEKLSAAHARAARGQTSRVKQLRQIFEGNRLQGPYFPLTRFGNYFVTLRDEDGKVTSFSRFETEREQAAWMEQAKKENLGKIESGVLSGDQVTREQVAPGFLADVEEMLQEAGADKDLMDQVWQRFLETLPDHSMRTSSIHRKGRKGFNTDAVRAFASAMFHGAHQSMRLRYGAEMEETLEEAGEQAAARPDANRAGFVVREMKQRHAFTMNPTNNPMVTKITGLAFVWYLGMSPAAAAVNLSQTTVVGVPLMAARYKKAGVTGVGKALARASKDFMRGKGKVTKRVNGLPVWTDSWSIENAPDLTADERKAMEEGYERGVIDKTQAHDLASVADSGVEYNATREKIMRVIGFMFHHGERFNREVTYLAAYRLARAEGMSHEAAISSASGMTWKVHFDYSNTARPRAMTGDAAKVFLIFRNFQVNMIFRLFRDTHQALVGGTKEERREARAQLIGISLSMFAHAGIRGVWGYGLLMMLLGMFFPGDGDDMDEWLQDALLIEGDNPGVAAWNWIMGLALNGAPGHALGMNLTNRIGMPDLLLRSPDQDMEGKDLWAHYTEQLLGPAFGIGGSILTGGAQVMDGQVLRGGEKMVPTFLRNAIKTVRYSTEGVTTYRGDELIDGLNPWQMLMQLQGFTPAEIAERYEVNNRLKKHEQRITDERREIMRAIGEAAAAGGEISARQIEKMRDFNKRFPEWAITVASIRQSMQSKARAQQRNEFGVSINPKINDRLRGDRAPALYN